MGAARIKRDASNLSRKRCNYLFGSLLNAMYVVKDGFFWGGNFISSVMKLVFCLWKSDWLGMFVLQCSEVLSLDQGPYHGVSVECKMN
jgi:hypothetical protein